MNNIPKEIESELSDKPQWMGKREHLIINERLCPECGEKLDVERNRDALSGDKYNCQNCNFKYEAMPTG